MPLREVGSGSQHTPERVAEETRPRSPSGWRHRPEGSSWWMPSQFPATIPLPGIRSDR